MSMIQDNISGILGKIGSICRKIGKDPNEIVLVGVTKFADIPKINEAIRCGLTHIAENKVQEACKKFTSLENAGVSLTRHMIGHLQTNKIKQALELFDLIQSVDSVKLALEIEKQAAKLNQNIDILVQVNTAGEKRKFGSAPDDVFTLIEAVRLLKHIRLLGLMAIAPLDQDEAVVRKCFKDLRLLRDHVSERYADADNIDMKYLSMGMTDDYKIALEEGSNMVRIGRAIFQ